MSRCVRASVSTSPNAFVAVWSSIAIGNVQDLRNSRFCAVTRPYARTLPTHLPLPAANGRHNRLVGGRLASTASARDRFRPEAPCMVIEQSRTKRVIGGLRRSFPNGKAVQPAALANSSIALIVSRTSGFRPAGAGTSMATGTPCRVMVISSPWATRSNKAGKWVFAS